MKIVTAIRAPVRYGWPRAEQDGIAHQLYGYSRKLGAWTYRCGVVFALDAHTVDVYEGPLTCVACAAFAHLPGGTAPWI